MVWMVNSRWISTGEDGKLLIDTRACCRLTVHTDPM